MPSERIVSGLVEPQGLGEEPLYHFTRVYLLFLQGLFAQMPTGSYQWSDDENTSEIAVTDQAPIPRERVEQRPHILTMRGPAQYANLSLDQARKVDPMTGMKERTDLMACTMTLCCLAKLGPEAQRIAWIVMRNLRTFKTSLQRAGIFKVGDEVSMSPESPPGILVSPEADSEVCLITVQSPFFFQWTEQSTPIDSHRLRAIELHMQQRLLRPEESTTEARLQFGVKPATVRGVPVQGQSSPIDGPFQIVKT